MKRRLLCYCCVAAIGCGGDAADALSATLDLTVPTDPAAQRACVGVVGFDVEVHVGNALRPLAPALRSMPILQAEDCRLPSALSIEGIADSANVSVTITGRDSAFTPRVIAQLAPGKLNEINGKGLVFTAVSPNLQPVLLLDLPPETIADLVRIRVERKGGMGSMVAHLDSSFANDEKTRAFLSSARPAAFTMTMNTLAAGDTLRIALTGSKGTVTVTADVQSIDVANGFVTATLNQ